MLALAVVVVSLVLYVIGVVATVIAWRIFTMPSNVWERARRGDDEDALRWIFGDN